MKDAIAPEPISPPLRLTPAFVARVRADRLGWPKRSRFTVYYREEKNLRGSVEKLYGRLTRGEAVPSTIARAFVDYMRERRGWADATAESACEPALPSEEGERVDVLASPHAMLNSVAEQFEDCEEMYLHHPYRNPHGRRPDDPALPRAFHGGQG